MGNKPEYFTVKIEARIPVVLQYRILSESPEEAFEEAIKLTNQKFANPPKFSWNLLKRLKATVYTAGTSMIRFSKNLGR